MLIGIIADMLNIKDVSRLLGFTDGRRTKKWLGQRHIPIKELGRDKVIFRFHFDFTRQLEVVEELKIMHPITWAEIYEVQTDDPKMVKAVFKVYPPIKKAKKSKQSKNEQQFF